MKKTLFIITISLFAIIDGKAQNAFPMDTVIYRPPFFTKYTQWSSYNLFDTLQVLQYYSSEISKTLVNGMSLDSCYNDKNLGQTVLYANNMIYFQMEYSDSISTYSPVSKIYKKFPAAIHCEYWQSPVDLSKTQLYRIENRPQPLLYDINSKTGKETLIADFRPFTNKKEYKFNIGTDESEGSIEQVCAIGKSSYILKTGIWEQWIIDSYSDVKYFKVNNGKIDDITNTVTPWIQKQKTLYKVEDKQMPMDELHLHMPSSNSPFIRGLVMYRGSGHSSEDNASISVIVDHNLQLVGTVLTLRYFEQATINIAGINQQRGKTVNYFMYSYLNDDDKNKVIVPYVFSPHLDTLMYNAYHGKILKKEELQGFGKYELGILRNLVFAKYNYAFTSEFYQAYFNLYEFYGNKNARKSRIKDVNDKLMAEDKANIKIITEAESKLK